MNHLPLIVLRNFFFLWLTILLGACSGKEDESAPAASMKVVRVLFSMNGLGDLSFNDDILRGVMLSQKENGFSLHYYIPSDPEDAKNKLQEWMREDYGDRTFTILATNEYESLAQELINVEWKNNYLLLEASSRDITIPVLCFSGYGVSFLAGVAAYSHTQGDTVAYIGGQRGHGFIEECSQGFQDGFQYAGGKDIIIRYLSDQPEGFAMSVEAYIMADSLYRYYPFIYAVAGGSNNGIYQFLREHPDIEGYTAGVDVDQSAYSDRIIGSMIKEIGRCIGDYIALWLEGEVLPEWALFDLQSEYTYFQSTESYNPRMKEIIDTHFNVACIKEAEFNEKRYR